MSKSKSKRKRTALERKNNALELENQEEAVASRTAIKHEMLALQSLGEDIVKLSKGQLATIPLEDPTLIEAIQTARRIKHREGLRRQLQYIGKLMRNIDVTDIQKAHQNLLDGRKEEAQHFHQLEQWRDRLIEIGPSSIEEVIEKYPQADRQYLRQLISGASKDQTLKKPPANARKLFRYMRELDEEN